MRRRRFGACLIVGVAIGQRASADDGLWAGIAGGGLVLLMRHAQTEPGIGDPPGFRLEDCTTQRNLSLDGRARAAAVGNELRARGLMRAEVRSSAWCRCRETAELLALGPVVYEPALDSFFENRSREPEQTAALERLIAGWRGPRALVLVTHQVNIAGGPGRPLLDVALSMLVRVLCCDGLEPGSLTRWRDEDGHAVTVHGLRSTFPAWCRARGVEEQGAEAAWAHVDKDRMRAAYARSDLLEQRRAVMERGSWFASARRCGSALPPLSRTSRGWRERCSPLRPRRAPPPQAAQAPRGAHHAAAVPGGGHRRARA